MILRSSRSKYNILIFYFYISCHKRERLCQLKWRKIRLMNLWKKFFMALFLLHEKNSFHFKFNFLIYLINRHKYRKSFCCFLRVSKFFFTFLRKNKFPSEKCLFLFYKSFSAFSISSSRRTQFVPKIASQKCQKLLKKTFLFPNLITSAGSEKIKIFDF